MLLPVSVPSHCALMKPAAEQLGMALTSMTIYKPVVPVIHNANVGQGDDDKAIKHLLTEQLHNPVRWVETIQKFSSLGVTNIIECGPGKVLAGLTKRIDKSLIGLPIFDQTSLEKVVQVLGEQS